MNPRHAGPSAGDVAGEVAGLAAGLGILTTVLFPFALPLLFLVILPVAVLGIVGALLAAPVVVAIWLVRSGQRVVAHFVDRAAAPDVHVAVGGRAGQDARPAALADVDRTAGKRAQLGGC
jgi:hypothetical protein